LKGFQRLNCSLEADRSWFDAVFGSDLRHDRADEIVGENGVQISFRTSSGVLQRNTSIGSVRFSDLRY